MVKKWKCSVCGYVQAGEEPPGLCPLCGADKSKFILLEQEKLNLLHDLVASLRVHSVAGHFPNGLIPALHIALLCYAVTGRSSFETTAVFLLALSLAVVPISMASGLYDWRRHYAHIHAKIFFKKIILAFALLLVGTAALWIRLSHPQLWEGAGSNLRSLYLVLLSLALVLVVLLGHYGGKLVFEWRKQRP